MKYDFAVTFLANPLTVPKTAETIQHLRNSVIPFCSIFYHTTEMSVLCTHQTVDNQHEMKNAICPAKTRVVEKANNKKVNWMPTTVCDIN